MHAPGGHYGQKGRQVVDGVLLAHAVMGAKAESQEILLMLQVLAPVLRKAVGVKSVRLRVPLQAKFSNGQEAVRKSGSYHRCPITERQLQLMHRLE